MKWGAIHSLRRCEGSRNMFPGPQVRMGRMETPLFLGRWRRTTAAPGWLRETDTFDGFLNFSCKKKHTLLSCESDLILFWCCCHRV